MRFEKGQRVHVLLSSNERRYSSGGDPFREGVVARVGRKYVYVTFPGSYGERKFEQGTGYEFTQYPGNAAAVMDDEARAVHDRRAAASKRFSAINLDDVRRRLDRFSVDTIEKVLDLLEADYAANFEDVTR